MPGGFLSGTGRRSWAGLGQVLGHSRTRTCGILRTRGPPSPPGLNPHAGVALSHGGMSAAARRRRCAARGPGPPPNASTEKTLFHAVPDARHLRNALGRTSPNPCTWAQALSPLGALQTPSASARCSAGQYGRAAPAALWPVDLAAVPLADGVVLGRASPVARSRNPGTFWSPAGLGGGCGSGPDHVTAGFWARLPGL